MIIKNDIKVPLYHIRFGVLFVTEETKVNPYYDDLGSDYLIRYAHMFEVNTFDADNVKKQCVLIAFNLGNEHSKVTHGVVSHEIFHAASYILHTRDLELNDGSEEAFAYLIQFLTDTVYNIIKVNNIKIY